MRSKLNLNIKVIKSNWKNKNKMNLLEEILSIYSVQVFPPKCVNLNMGSLNFAQDDCSDPGSVNLSNDFSQQNMT